MLCLVVMGVILAAGSAMADGDLFGDAVKRLGYVFKNVRTVVYVLGGFALIGFAIAAIFGKLEWKKVAILAVGLALLVAAGEVVKYAVDADSQSGTVTGWEEAFGNN